VHVRRVRGYGLLVRRRRFGRRGGLGNLLGLLFLLRHPVVLLVLAVVVLVVYLYRRRR